MASARDSFAVALDMPPAAAVADAAADSPSDDEARDEGVGRPTARDAADGCCRNALAFLFLFYNMTLNLFVLAVVHERVPAYVRQPLPDIAFDLLPKADWTLSIAEYVIIVQVSAVLCLIFLHRYRSVLSQPRWRLAAHSLGCVQGRPLPPALPHHGRPVPVPRRVHDRDCPAARQPGLLLFASGQSVSLSAAAAAFSSYLHSPPQLFNSSDPDSQRVSSGQFALIIFSRVFHMLTGFGLSINGKHNYCGDYIYSGHTVSVTISKLPLEHSPVTVAR